MGVSWIGVARAGLESVRRAAEIAQAEPIATDNTVSSLKRMRFVATDVLSVLGIV